MTRDGPFWLVALSVASGASLGALLRWGFSYVLLESLQFLLLPSQPRLLLWLQP